MSRKRTILIFALLIHTFFAPSASAAPAAPKPLCYVTANVLSVEKKHEDRFRGNPAYPPVFNDYYSVKLDILSIASSERQDLQWCDDDVAKALTSEGGIYRIGSYDKQPIFSGQKISASVRFGGDEFFGGLFLEDIKTLGDQ